VKIINDLNAMLNLNQLWETGKTIGFVPTMGYLHDGHLSLIEKSNRQCDITIVSIYINPAQFAANEDLSNYPKDLDRDLALLNNYKVDYVFVPSDAMMYPKGYKSWITVYGLSEVLCGASRPVHFKGVATIVAKLVNLVNPDFMFMGEKDYQQMIILETMLKDLNFHTRIVRCPIVREKDGLAMSSRNKYLSKTERKNALCLSQSLKLANDFYKHGETNPSEVKNQMTDLITKAKGKIDYIAFVDKDSLAPVKKLDAKTRVIMAVFIGKTRLIDNCPIVG
jgi:pantoate--beta-alanine ligase